jgi:ribosomal protein L29
MIKDKHQMTQRQFCKKWREYLSALFNLELENQVTITNKNIHKIEELKPNILLAEIRTSAKAAPNNKSPGADNIPADLIKAMGEVDYNGYIDGSIKYG